MKRRLLSVVWAALLLVRLIPMYASGADPAKVEIEAAYWQDNMLYTFARLESAEQANREAVLIINNRQTAEAKPVKLTDAHAAVHYMLLVDTSNSMGWCRNSIISFAQQLMESNENVKMSIAKFDRSFSVACADATDWETVKASLESLTFYKDGSDINGSAAAAMEYLGSENYDAGELVNLIVITDGEPWYSNDGNLEKQLEDESNQKIAALMKAYPEILVHTLSFMDWKAAADSPYHGNNGLHFVKCKAEKAADALIGYVDSLYTVVFPVGGYRNASQIPDALMLQLGMDFVSYGTVRNTAIVPETAVDVSQEHIPEETLTPTLPAATDAPETVPPETADAEPVERTEAATLPKESVPAEIMEDGNVQAGEKELAVMIWAAIGLVILTAVGIIVFAVWKKRSLRNDSVRMKINLLAGADVRLKEVYYLYDEIRIGAEKNCDIRIPERNGMVNFRIVKREQMICVEDLGTNDGILLNNMRLFSANRLRSGDEITAGNVVIQILF